jgi:hypothetical protein
MLARIALAGLAIYCRSISRGDKPAVVFCATAVGWSAIGQHGPSLAAPS